MNNVLSRITAQTRLMRVNVGTTGDFICNFGSPLLPHMFQEKGNE